jgi:DNA-binding transcriptional MerR regulator
MQQYSIGAVSKLTNIPAHTLRKWESRHGIATPLRSQTGRRVYTDEHVETLKLIKRLMASGHSLAHLAQLDDVALRDLADQFVQPDKPGISSIVLVGPNISRLLPNERIVSGRFGGSLVDWFAQYPLDAEPQPIAVESETLPTAVLELLLTLRPRVERLLVVYTFASSETLAALREADIDTVRSPVGEEDLLLHIAPKILEPSPEVDRSERFSTQELARISALNTALECECPNHIAKLLMDITAFEKYSRECSDADPDSKALHDQLGQISASARVLFEDALIAVASEDGIELESIV